jgi:hypothetical protein
VASLVDVVWTMRLEESGTIVEPRYTTLMPPWAATSDGDELAARVVEDYFDRSAWAHWFGAEEDEAPDLILEIHAPASAAGRYTVGLSRRPRAEASRVDAETFPVNSGKIEP